MHIHIKVFTSSKARFSRKRLPSVAQQGKSCFLQPSENHKNALSKDFLRLSWSLVSTRVKSPHLWTPWVNLHQCFNIKGIITWIWKYGECVYGKKQLWGIAMRSHLQKALLWNSASEVSTPTSTFDYESSAASSLEHSGHFTGSLGQTHNELNTFMKPPSG